MSGVSQHVTRVRALYKGVLKLHRGLPVHMQALGDQYVREEFRRHRDAGQQEVDVFMHEWTKYYVTLARQLGPKHKFRSVGENLSAELMENFNHEQMGQLKELFDATTTATTTPTITTATAPAADTSGAEEKR